MNILQPLISITRQITTRVKQGVPISPFTNKNVFSPSKHNEHLAVTNALANPKLFPPSLGKITLSNTDILFDLSGVGTGSGSGGGMNYRGAWDGGTDYAPQDVVYVGAAPTARYWYVAELASGPHTAVQVPDPNEASAPLYWRLIASPSSSAAVYIVDSHGTGADTDYVWAHPQSGGAMVKVLKPYLIRFSIAARNGITYDQYDSGLQTRVAHAAGDAVTQYITPKYLAGDQIYVQSVGGVLSDMDADGRTFAAP